jgi:hypothetical protein
MGNEATLAGLKLRPSRVEWKWEELENTKPTESLNPVWYFFEILPFKKLSYGGAKKYNWYESFRYYILDPNWVPSGGPIAGRAV